MAGIILYNNLYNLISKGDIHQEYILHFYHSLFVMDQIGYTDIAIIDDSGVPYDELWQQDGSFYQHHAHAKIVRSENIYSEPSQVIICHRHCSYEVGAHVINNGGKILFFDEVFKDVSRLTQLLPATGADKGPATLQHSTSSFAKSFTGFKGFSKTAQEDFFLSEIAQIRLNNLKAGNRPIHNILILDNQTRPFFIGDSYLWLVFLKKLILSFAGYRRVTINSTANEHFAKLQTLFSDSLPEGVHFSTTSYADIPFDDYQLILCEADSQVKFFGAYAQAPYRFLNNAVFTFDAMNPIVQLDQYRLDYSKICSRNLSPVHLNQYRNDAHREIIIRPDEVQASEDWLTTAGLLPDEAFIIFVIESSNHQKVLPVGVCAAVIHEFLNNTPHKVLLFQSSEDSIIYELLQHLSPSQQARILISSKRALRKDMGLMSSKRLKAVIGPCTGMLHLASGIIHYFDNVGHYEEDRPGILVYTGKLSDSYNPIPWWKYAAVECVVIARKEGRKLLLSLKDCPRDNGLYNNLSLPVSEINSTLLLDYIRAWNPCLLENISI